MEEKNFRLTSSHANKALATLRIGSTALEKKESFKKRFMLGRIRREDMTPGN
jgi:hypothetical protein